MESDEIKDTQQGTQETNPLALKIIALEQELSDAQAKRLTIAADFENMRKRSFKDAELARFDAVVRVLTPLLDIIDDFDRALESIKENAEGLLLIKKSFEKLLDTHKVTVMECGSSFDPEFHEAVIHVADSGKEPGSIVAVLQKGYLLQGKVLRPARVSVAQ